MFKRAFGTLMLIGLLTLAGCTEAEPEQSAEVITEDPPAAIAPQSPPSENEEEPVMETQEMQDQVEDQPYEVDQPNFSFAEPYEPWADHFNNVFYDGTIWFTGLPTEEGLRLSADSGVKIVINLLPDEQQAERITFDEAALLAELGIQYERIPMVPGTFSNADVDRFADILEAGESAVLVHCASSNRCGGLWAAYLNRVQDIELESAIEIGKAAGLSRDSMIDAVRRVAGSE